MTFQSEENVLKMAHEALVDRKITYDHKTGFKVRFEVEGRLRGGIIVPVWVVSYLTEENPYFDQDMHFIYIKDFDGTVLYIVTPTTYIE